MFWWRSKLQIDNANTTVTKRFIFAGGKNHVSNYLSPCSSPVELSGVQALLTKPQKLSRTLLHDGPLRGVYPLQWVNIREMYSKLFLVSFFSPISSSSNVSEEKVLTKETNLLSFSTTHTLQFTFLMSDRFGDF